jgi:sec-independent protein translocase protein TatB
MFDLSLPKLLILAVLALVVFGPNELPTIAAKVGRALHDLRRIGESAKADLREGLGPEFSDFDLDDLHPGRFAQKYLLSDLNRDDPHRTDVHIVRHPGDHVSAAERPPYDAEATTSSSTPGSSAPSAPVTTSASSPPATGEVGTVTPAPPPSASRAGIS